MCLDVRELVEPSAACVDTDAVVVMDVRGTGASPQDVAESALAWLGAIPGRGMVIVTASTSTFHGRGWRRGDTAGHGAHAGGGCPYRREGTRAHLGHHAAGRLGGQRGRPPTVIDFFGIAAIPSGMTGQLIRIDGTVDVDRLHRLHLEQRRIRLPVQLGEIAFVTFLFVPGLVLLVWMGTGRSIAPWLAATMRFLCLCGGGRHHPAHGRRAAAPADLWDGRAVRGARHSGRRRLSLAGPWREAGSGRSCSSGQWASLSSCSTHCSAGGGCASRCWAERCSTGPGFAIRPTRSWPRCWRGACSRSSRPGPWGASCCSGPGCSRASRRWARTWVGGTLCLAGGLWWAVRSSDSATGGPGGGGAQFAVAAGLAIVLVANRFLPGAPTHIAGFVEREDEDWPGWVASSPAGWTSGWGRSATCRRR